MKTKSLKFVTISAAACLAIGASVLASGNVMKNVEATNSYSMVFSSNSNKLGGPYKTSQSYTMNFSYSEAETIGNIWFIGHDSKTSKFYNTSAFTGHYNNGHLSSISFTWNGTSQYAGTLTYGASS